MSEDNLCALQGPQVIKDVELRAVPSYFSKLFPNRDIALFMSGRTPYAADLNTGKLTMLSGNFDPVPTPDGKLISVVDKDAQQASLWFFPTRVAIDHPKANPREELGNPAANYNVDYAYQSLGLVSSQGSKAHYRLLVDNDNGDVYIREENVTFDGSGGADLKDGDWAALCQNKPSLRKLPMISKDGSRVAAYSATTKKTVIYDISSNGNCKPVETLPYQTGKADFSFDGNYVTFQMSKRAPEAKWFEFASPNAGLNVYVWDLKNHKLKQITDYSKDGNCYFPTFNKDGKIGFIQQKAGKDKKIHYHYVVVDPKLSAPPRSEFKLECETCVKDYSTQAGLGELWNSVCDLKNQLSIADATSVAQQLKPESCKALVDKYWDRMADVEQKIRDDKSMANPEESTEKIAQVLSELPPEALKAACPGENLVAAKQSQVIKKETEPKAILKNSCTSCHSGEHPAMNLDLDFDQIKAYSLEARKQMAEKIHAGTMPPGGLPVEDRDVVERFLVPKPRRVR